MRSNNRALCRDGVLAGDVAKVMPGDELELLGFPELEELPRWLAQAAVRRLGLGKLPLGDIPVRFHPHHVTTR